MQGVDVWLNNPRRGEEACGTSGMKAGDQRRAQPQHSGRLVRRSLRDLRRLGHRRARAVFATIRTGCTPARFTPCWKTKSCRCSTSTASRRRASGCGASSSRSRYISPAFDCRRMVHEYMTRAVRAGALGSICGMRAGDYSLSREKAHWNARIREVWDRVRFVDAGSGTGRQRDQRQAGRRTRGDRPGRARRPTTSAWKR